jgi:hypothetical protein
MAYPRPRRRTASTETPLRSTADSSANSGTCFSGRPTTSAVDLHLKKIPGSATNPTDDQKPVSVQAVINRHSSSVIVVEDELAASRYLVNVQAQTVPGAIAARGKGNKRLFLIKNIRLEPNRDGGGGCRLAHIADRHVFPAAEGSRRRSRKSACSCDRTSRSYAVMIITRVVLEV